MSEKKRMAGRGGRRPRADRDRTDFGRPVRRDKGVTRWAGWLLFGLLMGGGVLGDASRAIAGGTLPAPADDFGAEIAPSVQGDTVELTLSQVLSRLQSSSPRLARQQSLLRAAAGVRHEASAARLPLLEMSAGYTRWSDVPEFGLSLPTLGRQVIAPDITNSWRSRVSLSAPLFTGGRIAGLARAAADEEAAARSDLDATAADLRYDATAAYWSLVSARARARVLAEGLRAFDRHLVDAGNRASVGLAARSDVLAVSVERARAELSLVQARSGVAVAEANLRRLLDLSAAVTPDPLDSLGVDPIDANATGQLDGARLDSLVSLAERRRPDRQALASRVRALEARAASARGTRWPQVSAGAGHDYARPNRRYTPAEDRWSDSWDASVQLSLILLDAGRTSGAVERAVALLRAAREQQRELDQSIRFDVTARLQDLGTARQGVVVSARALEAARENARVVADRFQEGVASSSEMLDAEVLALRAEQEHLDARVQWKLAEAALDRSVGRAE